MALTEIVVSIPEVFKEVARRTSLATETDAYYAQKSTESKQYSQLHGEGDRITTDFVKEAAKEVLKAYITRQGDLADTVEGFEFDNVTDNEITYRFMSDDDIGTSQYNAIKERLTDNTKDAIIYYVLASLYRTDGNANKEQIVLGKAYELIDMLTGDLYRLHD